jgi:hypothetical protein
VIRYRGGRIPNNEDGLSNAKPMLFSREMMGFAALRPSYMLVPPLCGIT